MTKSVAYVQKYYASILLAAVLGYIGWIGIELNALGKDVATLKANDKFLEHRLSSVETQLHSIVEILARIEQRMARIEQGMLLSQGGKGGKKGGKAETP